MSAARETSTADPSRNGTIGVPAGDSISPAAARTAPTTGPSIGTFFGDSASMHGGMIDTTAGSTPSQAYAARENTSGVRGADVVDEEAPGLAREVVGSIDADVADPDHVRTLGHEPGRQPRGLRVVQHDHVAGSHERLDARAFAGRGGVVHGSLVGAERTAVAERAVQPVVDALRDPKKPGRPRSRAIA